MTSLDVATDAARRPFPGRRARLGDLLLQGAAGIAALGAFVLVGLILWKVIQGARLALSTFGLGFVWHLKWDQVHHDIRGGQPPLRDRGDLGRRAANRHADRDRHRALPQRAGPARNPRTGHGDRRELAAIPSVVIGLWGLLVLAPVLRDHVDPALHSALYCIPLFGPPGSYGSNVFTAIVVLTIMILPIIASISRELFLSVPVELKEGTLGLGTTRWEMIRGVVLPYTRGGVGAAMILGFGRAIGEAIAVALVIGAVYGISVNFFNPGYTLAGDHRQQLSGRVVRARALVAHLAARSSCSSSRSS